MLPIGYIYDPTTKLGEWFSSSWDFAKQILPLLFAGVLVAGALGDFVSISALATWPSA